MTTIAVCRRFIAWDSRYTVGGSEVHTCRDPKVVISNGVVYGAAGSRHVNALIKWYERGRKTGYNEVPSGSWSLLVIDDGKIFYFENEAPDGDQIDAPFAIGSGASYALGAMSAGKDAIEAVEIAAHYDAMTGGPFSFMDYTTNRPLRRSRGRQSRTRR